MERNDERERRLMCSIHSENEVEYVNTNLVYENVLLCKLCVFESSVQANMLIPLIVLDNPSIVKNQQLLWSVKSKLDECKMYNILKETNYDEEKKKIETKFKQLRSSIDYQLDRLEDETNQCIDLQSRYMNRIKLFNTQLCNQLKQTFINNNDDGTQKTYDEINQNILNHLIAFDNQSEQIMLLIQKINNLNDLQNKNHSKIEKNIQNLNIITEIFQQQLKQNELSSLNLMFEGFKLDHLSSQEQEILLKEGINSNNAEMKYVQSMFCSTCSSHICQQEQNFHGILELKQPHFMDIKFEFTPMNNHQTIQYHNQPLYNCSTSYLKELISANLAIKPAWIEIISSKGILNDPFQNFNQFKKKNYSIFQLINSEEQQQSDNLTCQIIVTTVSRILLKEEIAQYIEYYYNHKNDNHCKINNYKNEINNQINEKDSSHNEIDNDEIKEINNNEGIQLKNLNDEVEQINSNQKFIPQNHVTVYMKKKAQLSKRDIIIKIYRQLRASLMVYSKYMRVHFNKYDKNENIGENAIVNEISLFQQYFSVHNQRGDHIQFIDEIYQTCKSEDQPFEHFILFLVDDGSINLQGSSVDQPVFQLFPKNSNFFAEFFLNNMNSQIINASQLPKELFCKQCQKACKSNVEEKLFLKDSNFIALGCRDIVEWLKNNKFQTIDLTSPEILNLIFSIDNRFQLVCCLSQDSKRNLTILIRDHQQNQWMISKDSSLVQIEEQEVKKLSIVYLFYRKLK